MARKKGFLGVLRTDPLPMSNSLSSDTIWFHPGYEALCGVPYPVTPYVGYLPNATAPPPQPLAKDQVDLLSLLGVSWMSVFSTHHCFSILSPSLRQLFLVISIIGPSL